MSATECLRLNMPVLVPLSWENLFRCFGMPPPFPPPRHLMIYSVYVVQPPDYYTRGETVLPRNILSCAAWIPLNQRTSMTGMDSLRAAMVLDSQHLPSAHPQKFLVHRRCLGGVDESLITRIRCRRLLSRRNKAFGFNERREYKTERAVCRRGVYDIFSWGKKHLRKPMCEPFVARACPWLRVTLSDDQARGRIYQRHVASRCLIPTHARGFVSRVHHVLRGGRTVHTPNSMLKMNNCLLYDIPVPRSEKVSPTNQSPRETIWNRS